MATRPDRDAFLTKARERFKAASEANNAQAEREREDLAFYAGDQWPADLIDARKGQQAINGMPAVPARPTLVINKVREPVRQLQNEIRDSDIGIELVPADDFGDLGVTPDDTEVTLREGLVRRIQRDSDAQDARNWAGDRASQCGRGYYLVMTRYLPGKTNDQEIYLHRIYDQRSVVRDPAREQPDGSDSEFDFIGTWVPWDRYAAEYPTFANGEKNPYSDATESDFVSLTESYPDWYQTEGDQRSVRVVDYWYKQRATRTLVTLSNGDTLWEDEIPKTGKGKQATLRLPEGVTEVDRRAVPDVSIHFCKIGGGVHKLEETEWPGPDMPLIEVLGEELQPYDSQRRVEGMVRQARGSQQGFNYMVSKQVETIGLTPIPPLQVDPDAIEGYEAWYQVANTRTLPYLPSRTYDDNGRQLKEPHRPAVDPNILPIAQSIALFNQSIQDTTAMQAPSLGKTDPSVKSARHAKFLIDKSAGSTSNFLSNRIRSMRYEGKVINNLLYAIYGSRPGRLVRIMTGEGQPEAMMIGDSQELQMQQRAAKVARLTKDAQFNIAIKITKNFDTRRMEEASMVGELIAAEPQLMTWFGDLYLQSSDMPNRKQMAERAKAMLAPPIQQMLAQKEQGQEIPPIAQQQIAQLTERVQLAEAAMRELAEEAKGKKIDQQTKITVAQLQSQRDEALETLRAKVELEKARMDNATKQYIADVQAKTKGQIQAAEAEHDMMATQMAQSHEAEQKQLDRESQSRIAAHDAAIAAGEQDFEGQQAGAERAAAAREGAASRAATAQEGERNRQAAAREGDADRKAAAQKPKEQSS